MHLDTAPALTQPLAPDAPPSLDAVQLKTGDGALLPILGLSVWNWSMLGLGAVAFFLLPMGPLVLVAVFMAVVLMFVPLAILLRTRPLKLRGVFVEPDALVIQTRKGTRRIARRNARVHLHRAGLLTTVSLSDGYGPPIRVLGLEKLGHKPTRVQFRTGEDPLFKRSETRWDGRDAQGLERVIAHAEALRVAA